MTAVEPACFNCAKTTVVGRYSLDLDLPAIPACPVCVLALLLGDDETLKALRPRQGRARTTP